MAHIVDRRSQGKNKSAVNRGRFLGRHKDQIKESVNRAIKGRSITNINGSEKISIPVKDINEPYFGHDHGGVWETVRPGNEDYVTGDRFKRPQKGAGRGGKGAGNSDEESEDDFFFELSREEFMQYFFEELELPDMVKTQLMDTTSVKNQRAGYKTTGEASRMHVLRSMRGALSRRIATGSKSVQALHEAQDEITELLAMGMKEDDPILLDLLARIKLLDNKLARIPFIDTFDLRYSNTIQVPKPSTKAVMFCIMDVSASMRETEKDIAKRFFILLYLFLTRSYEKIEVVFIRHHTSAMEVSEEVFFNDRASGGTVVSSALELTHQILTERYPASDWNAYVAQASDGDNWEEDSLVCKQLILENILPLIQYYAYVEITKENTQNLWVQYQQIAEQHKNFAIRKIEEVANIYPIFCDLFKKQQKVSE